MRPIRFGLLFALALILAACSTQKNRFVNRQYHRLTTAYNVLFNGEEAFSVGKSILEASVEDNFFELLEVEPIALSGENVNTTTLVPGFDRAEEKAVKAIQKHSMREEGVQQNDQIDKAYLLLGKARYYDRRFFPALEAFNFLLESYGSQQAYIEGLIWREKTNIRLLNNELAIGNLRPLARNLLPQNRNYSTANATVAQAFMNLKAYDSAQYYIDQAAQFEKNKALQGRYFYISGQLLEKMQQPEAAQQAYANVLALKKKTPRKYWIHARIKQQLAQAERDTIDPSEGLLSLLKKYENQSFSHVIYRALGNSYLQNENDSLALVYFTASQRTPSLDEPTQKANYRDLADYYFAHGAYKKAGAYLDSLIPLLYKNPLTQKRTQRARDNLEGVLKYENDIKKTDSLLRILAMPKDEQHRYFENYLEEKKRQVAAIVSQNLEAAKKQRLFRNDKESTFYFYRPNLVAQGKQRFLATWGDRPNVDNWRSAERIVIPLTEEETGTTQTSTVSIQVEDVKTLLAQLPPSSATDSLRQRNHQSYLKVGLLYKEQFDNNPLAEARLDTLLSKNPAPAIAAPALYHRFRLAEASHQARAEKIKNQLIATYPDSPFAQLLKRPDFQLSTEESSPEQQYQALVEAYQNGDYTRAIQQAKTLKVILSATEWAPKIAFLMANIEGKFQGKKQWIQQLKAVVEAYPQSETADHITELLKKLEQTSIKRATFLVEYKSIFPVQYPQPQNRHPLQKVIEEATAQRSDLRLSIDTYSRDYQFLVVHGFRSATAAEQFRLEMESLFPTTPQTLEPNNFVALSSEYQNLQLNKTWDPFQKIKQK